MSYLKYIFTHYIIVLDRVNIKLKLLHREFIIKLTYTLQILLFEALCEGALCVLTVR